jgi:hypothetical protein
MQIFVKTLTVSSADFRLSSFLAMLVVLQSPVFQAVSCCCSLALTVLLDAERSCANDMMVYDIAIY